MNEHEMWILKQHYDSIEAELKWIEVRLAHGMCLEIKIGDVIIFKAGHPLRTVRRKVTNIRKFETFDDALSGIDLALALPGHSREQARNLIDKMYPHGHGGKKDTGFLS